MVNLTYQALANRDFLEGYKKLDTCNKVSAEQMMAWLRLSEEMTKAIDVMRKLIEKAPEREQDFFAQDWDLKSDKIDLAHAVIAGLTPRELRAMRGFIKEQWGD